MDIVVALPMRSHDSLPKISAEIPWQDGSLSRVTASGTPGEQIVNLISKEFPNSLQKRVFERRHINLWDAPIEVSERKSLQIVAIEWINTEELLPDICLIHLEATKTINDHEAIGTFIESITRTWRKESQLLLNQIFVDQDLVHESLAQGLALIGSQGGALAGGTETRGHLISHVTNENDPKLVHAYGAHVITLIALQLFSLNILNSLWPKNISDRKQLLEFSQTYLNFRHHLNWGSLFINSDSRRIYRSLRDSLNIEKRFSEFGVEINEALTATQNRSAIVLTKVASVIAISALVPVWFPNIVNSLEIGIGGLSVTGILIAIILKGK